MHGRGRQSPHLFDRREEAEIKSSFVVDRPIHGLFPLDSGEIAAVGVELGVIAIWKIKTP